ncbi:MAG: ABC transporter substrate-binding protein [Balneolaceae bacterium]
MDHLKYLFLFVAVASMLFPSESRGQSFDEGLEYYQQEQYEEALEIFRQLDNSEQALLYTGKSYLALGEYMKAGIYLRHIAESDIENISIEAYYTLALNEFRLKNFRNSLEILHRIASGNNRTGIQASATGFYNTLLRYLTDNQRFDLFWQTTNAGIRHDLVRSAVGHTDYSMLEAMMKELEKLSGITGQSSEIRSLRDEIGSRESYVRSPKHYPVPEGTVYPIGVALPSFETDKPEFAISRNLYFGIMLAAEEFNSDNSEKKVFLRFRDTHADPDSIPGVMNELIWNERTDAILGPLFSESAERMSSLAENYEIPILTPLANSDEINTGHNYTFQLNPTFSVHGEAMARFAVNEMNLDTLAVMVEQNSLGRSSALAFRREAERLGAYVAYYMEEDFASYGYDLSDITETFTRDPVLIDSLGYVPVKGIYAPFTGQAATTLVNLLMTDLEAMGSDVVVMGSEEWREARYTRAQERNFLVYYTQNHSSAADEESLNYFNEDFSNMFGIEPDHFARLGYDAGRYLFRTLEQAGNPEKLKQALREAAEYRGLATHIHFRGSQINRSVRVEPLTGRAKERTQDSARENVNRDSGL